MAVELTNTSANFIGTGALSTYSTAIYANDDDQIRVSVNGAMKTLGDDYVLNGLGASTGIGIDANFPLNSAVYVERNTPLKQEVDTQNNETILEDVLDLSLDKLTMMVQERAGETARALLVPRGETGFTLPQRLLRLGGKVLGFNGATGEFEVQSGGSFKGDPGGNAMAIGNFSVASTLNIPNGTDLVQTSGFSTRGIGQARYVYDPAVDATFVLNYPRMSFISANGRGFRLAEPDINVQMFGAKGDGVTDDRPALQEIAIYMYYYSTIRSLRFPQGVYCISDTIDFSLPISCAQFTGATGYDGTRGPLNFTLFTCLKWIGAANPAKPMVKFDRASGIVWRGISLNCDYKAGYGIQIMSSTPADGSVKNLVENCSIHYATRDAVIVGSEGVPSAPPAGRQFFGSVFRNMTSYGCQRSMFHINEWNADQLLFDTVMAYPDDNPIEANRVKSDNMFWFDHGGQWSILINCQVGGMDVQAGKAHSGYMIRNQGSDNGQSGAFGLHVINAWQEGAGGLYYGVTSVNDSKGNLFEHCASFTSNPANYSVYIDKGTSDPIGHTFIGCTFLSDIKIGTPALRKSELELLGCTFADGKGIIDPDGRRIIGGTYTGFDTTGGSMVIPRLVNTLIQQITTPVAIVYAESVTKIADKITLILTQDATGGRTIDWAASGNFSALPAIPAPNLAPGAKTIYSFVSDGAKYYLTGSTQ